MEKNRRCGKIEESFTGMKTSMTEVARLRRSPIKIRHIWTRSPITKIKNSKKLYNRKDTSWKKDA